MAMEGELWDDSALICAFDHAMSKYKRIHKKRNDKFSAEGGNLASRNEDSADVVVVERDGAARGTKNIHDVDLKDDSKKMEVQKQPATAFYADNSDGLILHDEQDASNGLSGFQVTEDYNQLLNEYYELEDKRQKILQRLQQFSNCNYQYSGEASTLNAYGAACSTTQELQIPEPQASHQNVVDSCCPYSYSCNSFAIPRSFCITSSSAGGCIGATCTTGNGKSVYLVEDDLFKTAMSAAEKAVSSLKTGSLTEQIANGDKVEAETTQEEKERESRTDLSEVLKAWYSAGFYTGKYLTEQSL